MRILAPAKLNLGLRIVGRRADGLHELESVFLPIDLADEIELGIDEGARANGVSLALSGAAPDVPADERNLSVRAALAFLDAAGVRARVRIALAKRIPSAAGLGGGSSDAGAVLRALAERFPGAVAGDALAALALALGADVPFFLDPRPALVRGVGEERAALPGPLPALAVVLANAGRAVPTARVFAAHAASAAPHGPRGRLARQLAAALDGPAEELPARLGPVVENDLEAAARSICPKLARVRDALEGTGALAVGLSGSGGTWYGIHANPGAAASALERIRVPAPGWARLARTAEAR